MIFKKFKILDNIIYSKGEDEVGKFSILGNFSYDTKKFIFRKHYKE